MAHAHIHLGSVPDHLAMVLTLTRHLIADPVRAEDAAVAVTSRFLTRSGPDWLSTTDLETHLRALVVLHVLPHNS